MANGRPQQTVSILVKDKTGRGPPTRESKEPWQYSITKGELVVEIPEEERIPIDGKVAANYRLLANPEIIFVARPTDVTPLDEKQLYYLVAVQPPSVRIKELYKEDKMKEKMEIAEGDEVVFQLNIKPQSPDSRVNGLIRYIGPLTQKEGYYFGIEILEKQYRGKGSTDGRPHFNCDPNNAVYVAMDKIVIKVKKPQHTDQSSSKKKPITGQPTSKDPSGTPAESTRSKAPLGGKAVHEIAAKFDNPSCSVDSSNVDSHQSQFQSGQRVVLQPAKGDTITGTVRWVGPIKDPTHGRIPAVGVETDQKINPEKLYPGLHLNVTGSHGQQLFNIIPSHGRVYLPEQLVLHAETYAEQQQKDNALKYKATELGLKVEEVQNQEELLQEAKKEINKAWDQKNPQAPEHGDGEELVAGAGRIKADNDLTQSVYMAQIGGTIDAERIRQEERALEQMKSQHEARKSGHTDTSSVDYQVIDGGSMNVVEGSYVDVAPYTVSQQGGLARPSPNLSAINEQEQQGYSPQAVAISTHSPKAMHHSHLDNEREGYTSLPSSSNTPRLNDAPPLQFSIGSMVFVPTQRGQPLQGVVQWIGTLADFPDFGIIAGVELEHPMTGCTDGTWQGRRFFNCPPGRAFFCPVTSLQQDTRFIDEGQIPANLREGLQNPLVDKAPTIVEDDISVTSELFTKYIGDGHGIQGHHNSCYLDSTVFGLFALSESFDELLLEEPQEEVGRQVKYFLWKGIVNPLRKYGLARHESVMDLRNSLEQFGQMKGAKTDEKDPEEFLNLLFKEVLHVEPFLSIKRPFGVEKEYFIQLFFEIDPKETQIPKTEKLLVQMFHEQNISFTSVPSKLLLQMPRFGKDFKMYNRIIPSLTLNVKPLLDPGKRGSQKCYFCLAPNATHACYKCPEEIAHNDDPYLFYCTSCNERAHWKRKGHRVEEVKVQAGTSDVDQISKLQLLSVICIETSHYVCYTRSGNRWLFHDSMADRYYDMYNIPKVVDVTQELQDWVYSEKGTEKLMTSAKSIPEYVRRFTQDIYMCVYVNPDLDLYGAPDMSLLGGTESGYQGEMGSSETGGFLGETREERDLHRGRGERHWQDNYHPGGKGEFVRHFDEGTEGRGYSSDHYGVFSQEGRGNYDHVQRDFYARSPGRENFGRSEHN